MQHVPPKSPHVQLVRLDRHGVILSSETRVCYEEAVSYQLSAVRQIEWNGRTLATEAFVQHSASGGCIASGWSSGGSIRLIAEVIEHGRPVVERLVQLVPERIADHHEVAVQHAIAQ